MCLRIKKQFAYKGKDFEIKNPHIAARVLIFSNFKNLIPKFRD